MNLSRRQMLALFGGIVLTKGCASRLATSSAGPLRDEVGQELARTKGVGMACAIVGPENVVWSEGFGLADIDHRRPMLADTLINVGSVAKTVTATAVMQLWEQKQFDLQDDVARYLPFPLRNPHFPDVPITFEQLLTHRSSIRDNGPAYDRTYVCGDSPVALPKWLKEYFTPGGIYWDETNWYGWAPGTANPPAEPPNYSNVGFGVLGYLVELLSQKPFPTFCKQRIFGPLGMRHTGWLLHDIDVTRHATPYLKVPDPITPEEVVFYQILAPPGTDLKSVPPGTLVPLRLYGWANYPDGSLRTSAHELARFLAAYLGQGRAYGSCLLKPETLALMFSDSHFGDHLCWGTRRLPDGRSVILHSGADAGVTSFIAFESSSRIGVVCVRNFRVAKEDNTRLITLLLDAGQRIGR